MLVCAAALAAHATGLGGGFVWLDHAHITDALATVPLLSLPSVFMRGFAGTGFYRPLMSLSLSLDAATGAGAWLFHLVSAAWHAAAAAMVLVAARRLGLSVRAAVVAALVFAVHPATSLVANAIAFRSEAMIAVALLALIAFHLQRRAKASAAALFCGALCKETVFVLGPLFLLALELDRRRTSTPASPPRWNLWIAEAAALLAAFSLRLAFTPTWRAQFAPLSLDHAVGMRLSALGDNALLLLAPVSHKICDAYPLSSTVSVQSAFGVVVLAALVVAAVKRRGPALLLLVALLPSFHPVPIMRWWSPHYVYVPLAFASMLFGQAIDHWFDAISGPRARWLHRALAGALAAGCLLSLQAGLRYRNDESLWLPEVAREPGCREGQFFLAEAAHNAGRLDEAGQRYENAIEGRPAVLAYVDRGSALQNLGVVRIEQKRFTEAAVVFRAALQVVSDPEEQRQLVHNLAAAELSAGHTEVAESLLLSETQRADAMPASLFVRAHALAKLNRKQEADALMARYRSITTK